MVDIEHGSLCPLEQDPLAVPQSEVDHQPSGLDRLGEPVEYPLQICLQSVRLDALLDPHGRQLLAHALGSGLDRLGVVNDVSEIREPDSDPLGAVAVGRADSTARGPDELVGTVVQPVEG